MSVPLVPITLRRRRKALTAHRGRMPMRLWAVLLCLGPCGCEGGLHRRGDHQLSLLGSYGHPIKGDVIWPDGLGRADNAGLSIGYNYFAADRFSVGAAITPYRQYNQRQGDAYSGELQLALRYYVAEVEFDKRRASSQNVGPAGPAAALFVEALGGMMQSSRSVPESGSHTNFTQEAGVGVELKLNEHVSWLAGYRLRHISNGQMFGRENPSQNDNQVYVGVGFSW